VADTVNTLIYLGFSKVLECASVRILSKTALGRQPRTAGGSPSLDRYSDALKSSGIIWDDRSLDGPTRRGIECTSVCGSQQASPPGGLQTARKVRSKSLDPGGTSRD